MNSYDNIKIINIFKSKYTEMSREKLILNIAKTLYDCEVPLDEFNCVNPDNDYEDTAKKIVDNLPIHNIISRFIFDEADKLGIQCNEINITLDPKYADDSFVDIVISDDSWKEFVKYKTEHGL